MLRILITGGSSGLGSALALAYAEPGAQLILWGRNEGRLAGTAEECRKRGSSVEIVAFDVRDIERSTACIRELDRTAPIDLAIFNAGVGGPTPAGLVVEPGERAAEIATVNFTAVVVGATTTAELMQRRRRGHIVLVGSIGESFPLPMAPTYSGAKAGLRVFAEALGLCLKAYGVIVTLVSPGFIDTPMSRQVIGPKPFMLPPEKAAAIIRHGVTRGVTRLVVPGQFAVVRALFVCLPRVLRHAILVRLKS